jgi:hypothetical protein
MRKTTVTCDRCKKEIVDKEQIWQIKFSWNCYPTEPDVSFQQPKAEWCRPCMIDLGLLGDRFRVTKEIPNPPPEPTIEDILREFIRQEVAQ